MQSNDIIEVLENRDARAYILRHIHDDVQELALRDSNKGILNFKTVLSLIEIYKKASSKLPKLITRLPALTAKMYEQSSSERIAEYKASLISGKVLIDLTAGLGVDDLAFRHSFDRVIALDVDPQVHMLAEYTRKAAGATNVERILSKAEEMEIAGADWVYLDPDRRSTGKRAFKLEEMQPSLKLLYPKLKKERKKTMIKLSPLFDIQFAVETFPDVCDIYVLSEKNDVKEVLLIIDFEKHEEVTLHAVNLDKNTFQYSGTLVSDHKSATLKQDQHYIYFPLSALVKSGLSSKYLNQLGIHKFSEFEYYGSNEAHPNEGSTCYEIISKCDPSTKKIAQMLDEHGRNFTLMLRGKGQREALLRKHKLHEGSEDILLVLNGKYKEAFLLRRYM